MRRLRRIAVVAAAAAVMVFACTPSGWGGSINVACSTDAPVTVNLSGTWTANDGGTYWVRQIGSCLWWTGFSGPVNTVTMGRTFANAFLGTVTSKFVSGSWADVPRGGTTGSGTLILGFSVSGTSGRLYKISGTGSAFGGSVWTRAPLTIAITKG